MSVVVPGISADVLSSPLRDRLLDAAEAVVNRDGVNSLTLAAVAAEAGVSKGGLLYHFSHKSSLIQAIIERFASRCDAQHAQAVGDDPLEAGRFTRAYVAARMSPPDPKTEPIHTALLAAAGSDPEYMEPFRRRAIEWQDRLTRDGIDPVLATIIRLAIDGLCLGSVLGMPVPQGELRRQVLDRLLEITRTPCAQNLEKETL